VPSSEKFAAKIVNIFGESVPDSYRAVNQRIGKSITNREIVYRQVFCRKMLKIGIFLPISASFGI
jgi:hypothetical protein